MLSSERSISYFRGGGGNHGIVEGKTFHGGLNSVRFENGVGLLLGQEVSCVNVVPLI